MGGNALHRRVIIAGNIDSESGVSEGLRLARVNCTLAERTFEVVNLEEETCRQDDGDVKEAEQQRSTSQPEDTTGSPPSFRPSTAQSGRASSRRSVTPHPHEVVPCSSSSFCHPTATATVITFSKKISPTVSAPRPSPGDEISLERLRQTLMDTKAL